MQFALLFLGLVGLALLLWRGATWDRAAVGAMLMGLILSYAVQGAAGRDFQPILILIDCATFVGLWFIAERAGRWWIVMTAALHLVSTLVYATPFFTSERLTWAAVTLTWALWFLISLTFFFGVWEVEADRRFAFGGRDGSTLDDGGGARAAATLE
ncbi:hypothetical protein D3C73_895570 [compost metagenome]